MSFIKQNIFNKVILFFTVLIIPLIIAAFINMFWILAMEKAGLGCSCSAEAE